MLSRTIDDSGSVVALEFPAAPEHLAEVRRTVEQVADRTAMRREDVDDFLTAVDEAVANAIRHGSPAARASRVRVVCRRQPEQLEVEVRDQGRGFSVPRVPSMPGPDALGGRGLPMMCALADAMQVESTSSGTAVTLRKRMRG